MKNEVSRSKLFWAIVLQGSLDGQSDYNRAPPLPMQSPINNVYIAVLHKITIIYVGIGMFAVTSRL